ncbi:hypothetical protein EVAR_35355_1, partial [Eumeta japonica]
EMLEPTTMRRTKTILNLERIEEEAITPKRDSRTTAEKDPKEKSSFQDLPVPDATASQRPQAQKLPLRKTFSNLDQEPRISQMLEAVGLADLRNTIDVQGATNGDVQKKLGESFETPLGSLDRTKVSLGDSDKTTESIKMILCIINAYFVSKF